MSEDIVDKIVIVGIIGLFVWFIISHIDNTPDGVYKVDLRNEPIKVCGEEIYFSNNADGNELDIDNIIEDIEDACKY